MSRVAILVVLCLAGAIVVSLPPDTVPVEPRPGRAPLRGAVHVHSLASDGGGTLDAISAAAARAGLSFVVVTDHGDGTRPADPPRYRSGVLCLDAVEISTDDGHVVALGMGPAPFPLGGEARDVVDDIRRLGGVGIAAHPDSAKPELRWRAWDTGIAGFEWLNGDSEWREEPVATLARVLLSYPFAKARALALLLDRPDGTLRRWDELSRTRRLVAIGGSDAHARLELTDHEPRSGRLAFGVPSYEAMFRAYSVTMPGLVMTGDAGVDASALVTEMQAGHLFTSVDALASPARLEFVATSAIARATAGDEMVSGLPVDLRVTTNAPAGGRTVLLRDGVPVVTADGPSLRFAGGPEPAVYRVEVRAPHAPGTPPVPWLLSNPIYVRAEASPAAPPPAAPPPPLDFGSSARDWTIEANARSKGTADTRATASGRVVLVRWALGGTVSESPYVAAVVPAGAAFDGAAGISLAARASRPMRVSVQLRGADGRRWRRSIYLEEASREMVLPLAEFREPGGASGGAPATATAVRDILFVVDTVNAAPGTNGQFWIERIAYVGDAAGQVRTVSRR